jgi:hypothetical protein
MAKQKLVKCPECITQCGLADKDFSCLAGTSIEELELIANVIVDDLAVQ